MKKLPHSSLCGRALPTALALLGALLAGPIGATSNTDSASKASLAPMLEAVWHARSPEEQRVAVDRVLTSGADFETVVEAIRSHRFSTEVDTGRLLRTRTGRFHYILRVPESYDPERSYPVRVFLHGGVSRPARQRDGSWWRDDDNLASEDHITVVPVGWSTAMWWQANQTENLAEILRELRRNYNTDENRVTLFGISDGGSGAYFQAFRAPDPWAAFVPFIGHPEVLANRAVGADGQMYVSNLTHRPILAINGGRDRLYPSRSVVPYVELFRNAGVTMEFVDRPESGHSVAWWREEVPRIQRFLEDKPRDPLPDRVSWETETTDRYQRFAWVEIEALGSVPGESDLDDPNTVTALPPTPTLGVTPESDKDGVRLGAVRQGSVADRAGLRRGDRLVEVSGRAIANMQDLGNALGQHVAFGAAVEVVVERRRSRRTVTLRFPEAPPPPKPRRAFPRDEPSGKVVAERRGNHFQVQTRGVTRFALLLSPDEVDFGQPIRVTTNGVEVFAGRIEPDLRTLLEHTAHDVDRTRLFAAQLVLDLTSASGVPQ